MSQLGTPSGGRGKINLSNLNRFLLVAEWCRLVGKEDKVAQVGPVSLGGRGNKSGVREAARQLGLSRQDVERAIAVASLSPEAQQTAHEVGNRWATKSKQLQASASRWVQLVDSWWTAGGQAFILPGKIVSQKNE